MHNSQSGVKRQITEEEQVGLHKKAREEKITFAKDTVHAFVEANIPLQKLDHLSMRTWLNKIVHKHRHCEILSATFER
ncbi:hypothetical protein PR048_021965 [Dryococelus australis]|uniref:Uncharacterized protein n=1 Tax=Dryococelus australis TaxID=614101 RepID=A0ABQ9GZR2_9NEOP|nr:hypothetical protein PR048_021965 [Dryococelus australis]